MAPVVGHRRYKRLPRRMKGRKRFRRRFRYHSKVKKIHIRLRNFADIEAKSGEILELLFKPESNTAFVELSKAWQQYRVNKAVIRFWPSAFATGVTSADTEKAINPDVIICNNYGYSRKLSYQEAMASQSSRVFKGARGSVKFTPYVLVKDTVESSESTTTCWRPLFKKWYTCTGSGSHDHRICNFGFLEHDGAEAYLNQPVRIELKVYLSFRGVDLGDEGGAGSGEYLTPRDKYSKADWKPKAVVPTLPSSTIGGRRYSG